MPAGVTYANIWCDAGSVDTNWIAYRLCAVDAGPARLALAALARVSVVLEKGLLEVIVAPSVV